MEEQKKVIWAGIIFIVLIALAVGIYYLFIREKAKEILPGQEVTEELPVQVPEEEPAIEKEALEPIQVELDKSDESVRELAKVLSSHKTLTVWLKTQDLIRKFVAAVDNIANGLSPRPQIDFFTPKGDFKVIMKNDLYYADPKGYNRYNSVADVFVSLDSEGCVRLYRRLKPLIQEAYQDLGYPEKDFEKTLSAAMAELLKVPVVRGEMRLEKKVISFAIADPRLENLSEAQKYLIRMGPENVLKIQVKIRELGDALGIPKSQLPRSRIYSPNN